MLHHGCAKLGIDDYWGPLDWWACQQHARALDAHTRFDMYCLDCGQRWLEFEGGPLPLKGPVTAEHTGRVWVEGLLSGDVETCPVCDVVLLTEDGTRLITRIGADGGERWECPDCRTVWQKDLSSGPPP